MRRAGGNGDILELDVLDVEAVRSAFSARPSYDILVNNAGTNRPIPFLNVEPDDFDAVCSLNVRAAFFVAQVVARGMVETGRGGSIIHMRSEEHTSELQSLMRISYAVFCLKKKKLQKKYLIA